MFHLSLVPRRERPRKMVEDFMSFPEGTLMELIDGELYKRPATGRAHQEQEAVVNLLVPLLEFARARRLGEILPGPLDVHLPSDDIVEPDVMFISNANRDIAKDWIYGVPDLFVEVISPESVIRDRIVKRHLYERNGLREYWIVDTVEQTIEVLSLNSAEFEPSGYFGKDEVLESGVLSELRLPLASIFDQ